MHRKNILIYLYIQQDATLHSLLYLETTLHVSGGTSTYHQERIQLYLQHLVFVTPLLLPSAVVEELELCSISWQVHGTVLKIIPLPSLWYSAQDTGVQINVLSIRKCVASKSVETIRRHETECLILHV